jgi:sugar phosphate isomerase/epimerase
VPTGVGLFTVRTALADDLVGTLDAISRMGYDGVEPVSLTGGDEHLVRSFPAGAVPAADPAELRRILDDLGLVTSSMHAPLLTESNANAILDEAAVLGTDLLVLSHAASVEGFGPETFGAPDELRRFADLLATAAELAARRGVRTGYHNHDFEVTQPGPERTALEELVELTDGRVFLEFDVTWVDRAGVDSAAIIDRLRDHVLLLHGREALGDAARAATAARWHIADLGTVPDDPMAAVGAAYERIAGG